MKLLASIRSLMSAFFHHSRAESDLDEELRAHVQYRADDLERSGITRKEAERKAQIDFGGHEKYKEEAREEQRSYFLEALMQDLRFGLRVLRKSPSFTAMAILTLALGIGANTAIFTLANTMIFQHLPVRASNRLVVIWINNMEHSWSRIGPSGQDYLDWKARTKSFEDLFLFEHGTGTVTGQGEPEQVAGLRVTTNFGDFFGIKPFLGRTFLLEEAAAKNNLIILSYHYWQGKFGSNLSIVGRGITLNGEQYTIIGVLPPEVSTVFPGDVVVPFDNAWVERADSDLGVFGRLKKGVTVAQASSEMKVVMQGIALVRPSRKGYGTVMVPLESARVEYIRPALLVLLGAVGFVLLIACANVANLMLSRSVGRQKEFALRVALGAGRGRMARQFLAESTLLALLGGGAGLLLAWWSTFLLMKYLPSRIPVPNAADTILLPTVHLDGTVLVFTLVISLVTGIIFGLVPIFQTLRCNVYESLKECGKGALSSPRGNRARSALLIAEGALAFILVIGAGLMIKSFSHLLSQSPGFKPDHLLTLRIKLPDDAKDSPYKDPKQQIATFQRFLTKIQAVPGVGSAAFAEIVPLTQDDMDMGFFVIKEQPPLPPGEHLSSDFRDISPDYFRTMGIPLIQGRTFTDYDNLDKARVVIIDESLARHFFTNQNPIGKHLQIPDARQPEREIVGIVGGVRDTGFDQQPRPTIYLPSQQDSDQSMSLVVRTNLPPTAILPAIKNAIWQVDSNLPVFNVRPMDEVILQITSAQRIAFLALDVMAFLALVLAAIGIYGVTSYAVGQRTREMGIRMALGAQPGDVVRAVLGQGLKPMFWGLATGMLAAVGLTRLMSSLLFGVTATDPLTFGGVALLLGVVALVACYIPARRAMQVDPMVALRHE
jgi:putative ABC transport system permease protein